MKKILSLIAIAAAASCAFTSCEKTASSEAPELSKIEFSINPCHPGDTVVATVKYAKNGKYFTFSEKLSSYSGLPTHTSVFRYNGTSEAEPFYTFVVGDTIGTFNVKYTGQVSYYSGQNLWGPVLTTTGKLVVEESE